MAVTHDLIDSFVSDGPLGLALRGCRCEQCRALFFPQRLSCERCGGIGMLDEILPTEGTLWSWTGQHFPPPSPPYFRRHDRTDFEPYFVGYVDLGEILVLSRLVARKNPPRIGARAALAWLPLKGADDTVPSQLPVFIVQAETPAELSSAGTI